MFFFFVDLRFVCVRSMRKKIELVVPFSERKFDRKQNALSSANFDGNLRWIVASKDLSVFDELHFRVRLCILKLQSESMTNSLSPFKQRQNQISIRALLQHHVKFVDVLQKYPSLKNDRLLMFYHY